jgi:molybdopterin converting factor small subunit
MKISVLFFGSLIDATGGEREIQLNGMHDIDSVKNELLEKYPHLENYTFRIALNQKILDENQGLNDSDVIALLPPFAGG